MPTFEITRFIFMRAICAIYFVAFLSLYFQMKPLIGQNGLMPAKAFLERTQASFWQLPTLFHFNASDSFMRAMCGLGVVLSFMGMVGISNGLLMVLLWFLYLSFVHVGQLFYGYGWETMLLEAGFLSIFLGPFLDVSWFPKNHSTPFVVVLMFRWMLFRTMFGAGMIKMRGDACWKDLTCLFYHFETQPIPNPLSWYFHHLPKILLKLGTLFNHFAELIVPFFFFGPRWLVFWGGAFTLSFQFVLILSGNLSWLNWLTIVLTIFCFDDAFFLKFLPFTLPVAAMASTPYLIILAMLTVVVLLLSIRPTMNLFSRHQAMNASFDQFHLVNTYGAFGSIGKERYEIILEGSNDLESWKEYGFKGKPGDVNAMPPIISPYHYRLDWQIWFAAMSNYQHNQWLVYYAYKLLMGDKDATSLLGYNPFPDRPPVYIRAELYRYRFTDSRKMTKAWWERRRVGTYFPAIHLAPSLQPEENAP